MHSKKYYFSKAVPVLSFLLGLPVTGLLIWCSADPTIFSNADFPDHPVMRWLAGQPMILIRLLSLALAVIAFDAAFLTMLVPYLRCRVAVEFTADHLVINAKYGLVRLPRDAIVDAYGNTQGKFDFMGTIDIQVKDAFKLRSWYGWRVNPTVETGNIAGLGPREFMKQFKSWI
jgi:hypothetical protein